MAEIGQGCSEPAEGFGPKFKKNRGILGYIIKNAQYVEKFHFFCRSLVLKNKNCHYCEIFVTKSGYGNLVS